MSWRTVVISRRAKLDLCLGYMEIRGESTRKVHLSEIHTLIIESTAVSVTASLLSALAKEKVKVIFCDEARNPQTELIPYYGSHDTSAKVRQQAAWDPSVKAMVWAEIIAEKIRQQMLLLEENGCGERAEQLARCAEQVESADASNREGMAARLYFGGLFGKDFTRTAEDPLNAALNYGYSILLSAFNREIAAAGYLTQLGIFHDNMFNPFNLASDMMEPFRPLVDRVVRKRMPTEFDKEMKLELVDILNSQVVISGNRQYVSAAIRIYALSVLEAINQRDTGLLRFYRYEEQEIAKRKKDSGSRKTERPLPDSALKRSLEQAIFRMHDLEKGTEDE